MSVLQPQTTTNQYRGMRAASLQLAQFLRSDFSSMQGEIVSAFPSLAGRVSDERTASLFDRVEQSISRADVPLRYLPICRRVAHEIATLYAQPPRRTWVDSGTAAGPIVEAYRRQRVDAKMRATQEGLVLQHTQILMVMPGGPDGFRLTRLDPYDVEIIPGNPLYADDIAQAERVRVQYPTHVDAEMRMFGVLEMTRDSIRWAEGKGGPFGEDGTNPFRDQANPYPIVAVRAVEPDAGVFYAPVNDPVRQAQIAVNLALTDIERVLRFDAHGLKILTSGADGSVTQAQADLVPFSVDRLIAVPGMNADLKVVGGQMAPAINAYVQYIQRLLEWIAVFLDISPDVLMKSNASKTAVSRQFDRLDRSEKRQRYEEIMQTAESDLYEQIVRVSRQRGIVYPAARRVAMAWGQGRQIPVNPLADAQALQARIPLGIDSAVAVVMREQGISRAQAEQVVSQYRADNRATVPAEPPIP